MKSELAVLDAAATMRVLANPARLEILRHAGPTELAVSELASRVGLAQASTSQHLRVLRDSGLMSVRVDGNRRYYRTSEERLSGLSAFLDDLWSKDLAALKATAERLHIEGPNDAH